MDDQKKQPGKVEQAAQSVVSKKVGQSISTKIAQSAIGKAVGGALGSVVPVFGNIIGGIAGNLLAGALTKGAKEIGKTIGALPFNALNALNQFANVLAVTVTQTIQIALGSLVLGFGVLALFIAFTLFIINSGAYVVPPGENITGPIDVGLPGGPGGITVNCTSSKGNMAFENYQSNPVANRGWEIVADLYQGFWCYWNRSPIHIATDTVYYPPSYPQYFNYPAFLANPRPNIQNGPAELLFWCTWLIVESYKEAGGISLPLNTLGVPTMQTYFATNGRYVPASSVTPTNVAPGDVIFFKKPGDTRLRHVGLVYTVTRDYILFVQSNAPTKTGSVTFSESGIGLLDVRAGSSSLIATGIGSL